MEQLLTTFDSTVEMISVKCNILHLNAESKKLLEQVGIKGEGHYYSFPRFFDLRLTSDSICAFLERLSKNIEVCKEPENLVWVFLVDFISDFLLNEDREDVEEQIQEELEEKQNDDNSMKDVVPVSV